MKAMRIGVAALVAALCGTAALAPAASAKTKVTTQSFASGPGWNAFSSDPGMHPEGNGNGSLGPSQNVCLFELAPPNCPPGATLWGFEAFAWQADLSAIPDATWIWAPALTGQSDAPELDTYWFSTKIVLNGHPTGGIVYVGADDFAEVIVNGTVVGTWGSTTDFNQALQAQSYLAAFDVTSYLKPGANVITIRGQNGTGAFAGCGPCTYGQNPAGIVFGGTLTSQQG